LNVEAWVQGQKQVQGQKRVQVQVQVQVQGLEQKPLLWVNCLRLPTHYLHRRYRQPIDGQM
jgi:hypothetical protein